MRRLRSTRRSSRLPESLLALTAILVAACGGGSSPPTDGGGGGGGGGAGDVQINMQNLAFKTSNGTDSITVAVGKTVRWTNLDQGIPHTVTSDSVPAGASPFASDLLSGSQSFTHSVDVAGRYVYHCQVHPGQMAHAVIIAR